MGHGTAGLGNCLPIFVSTALLR